MTVATSMAATVMLAVALSAFGQSLSRPTPLAQLLAEAQRNNSQIAAAHDAWQVAKQVPHQVRALPDPTFTYQNLSVGSPKPFAGYTSSDFAYIGIGAS